MNWSIVFPLINMGPSIPFEDKVNTIFFVPLFEAEFIVVGNYIEYSTSCAPY